MRFYHFARALSISRITSAARNTSNSFDLKKSNIEQQQKKRKISGNGTFRSKNAAQRCGHGNET